QRWKEVEADHRRPTDAAQPSYARGLDQQGNTQASFVRITLAHAERRIGSRRWLPKMDGSAVVGGKDYDGMILETELLQLPHQATHAVIHALDHRRINGVALAVAAGPMSAFLDESFFSH